MSHEQISFVIKETYIMQATESKLAELSIIYQTLETDRDIQTPRREL